MTRRVIHGYSINRPKLFNVIHSIRLGMNRYENEGAFGSWPGEETPLEWRVHSFQTKPFLKNGSSLKPPQKKWLYFERSPPWHLFVIVSDISSGCIYIYGIIVWHSILAFYLTFYSGILSDILFWQSIWHLFWHPIWHPVWHLYWHFLWHSIWHFVPYVLAYVMACYLAFYLTFYSGILSSIYSDILSGVQSGISSEILCGWGPVGDTLIQSSRCRSGGEDLDPELAVDVRPESLWSRGCCSGPAGHTAIKSLQLRSGGGRRRRKAGQLT